MPISANVLQPLIDFFEGILKFFHDTVGVSWGTSIIALTIVVRAALVPLTVKQFKSMQALARLQPEIKKLQAKYADDKQRLNQEMMRFYQENKVNPFSSCLPLAAQLPVFFSLFYMLRKDLRYDICPEINPPTVPNPKPCGPVPEAHFLGIPDITNKATGTVLVVLIVLYVASQLVSSLLMPSTVDRNQRMIFLALPFIFIPFVINFPAGLLVYWITTNLWTSVQQYLVRRTVGPIAPPSAGPGGGGGGDGGSFWDALRPKPAPEGGGDGNGAVPESAKKPDKVPAGGGGGAPPPRPPRKKKKRSGRRR
jgi:YidC/Oxa1 family membrane protein insertase